MLQMLEKAGEKAFEASMKTLDEAARHPSGRISGMVGPAQIDTCREGFFKEALQEARRRGLPLQTHACQAVVEFHEMVHRHGKTPTTRRGEGGGGRWRGKGEERRRKEGRRAVKKGK